MQVINISGRAGADSVIRETKNGDAILSVNVAVDQRVGEAVRLGFTRIAVPERCVERIGSVPKGVSVIPVKTIYDLLPLMIKKAD